MQSAEQAPEVRPGDRVRIPKVQMAGYVFYLKPLPETNKTAALVGLDNGTTHLFWTDNLEPATEHRAGDYVTFLDDEGLRIAARIVRVIEQTGQTGPRVELQYPDPETGVLGNFWHDADAVRQETNGEAMLRLIYQDTFAFDSQGFDAAFLIFERDRAAFDQLDQALQRGIAQNDPHIAHAIAAAVAASADDKGGVDEPAVFRRTMAMAILAGQLSAMERLRFFFDGRPWPPPSDTPTEQEQPK
jgi:hypothetical protein